MRPAGRKAPPSRRVWLHEPRVVITNPVADDPLDRDRSNSAAVGELRVSIDDLLEAQALDKDQKQVLEALLKTCVLYLKNNFKKLNLIQLIK